MDPVRREFIPIRQAINQGLFNTKTYLFFDPVANCHYSITEAAQRGLFKTAIDLRPEALVVERIKIAETVSLLSARDPANRHRLIDIVDAIKAGVVDTNLRIYRNTVTNEVTELAEAIESGLIQVQVLRETTEKITETLTEQKMPDHMGIIKKIDRSSTTSTNANSDQQNVDLEMRNDEDHAKIQRINGVYVYDRTKSLNVSKRLKKVWTLFVTDSSHNVCLLKTSMQPERSYLHTIFILI